LPDVVVYNLGSRPGDRASFVRPAEPDTVRLPAAPRAASRDPDDHWSQFAVGQVRAQYEAEIADVETLLQAEEDASTHAVLEKRLEVLQRRHEFIGKIGKILMNLSHQLRLLEDTFGLINDELRARSPDQVLTDIEDVVSQTNTMTELLEEVAPFEQMLQRISTEHA